jgi:hypothetical protein
MGLRDSLSRVCGSPNVIKDGLNEFVLCSFVLWMPSLRNAGKRFLNNSATSIKCFF